MVQAHIFISGFVQGVGYRVFVRNYARKHDITGWVKNLPDGRVEALFQGDKKNIEILIKICHQGPFLSEVKEVVIEWEARTSIYENFTVE